jgi:hypothetical protein
VFPTSAASNPTLTIAALALRAVEPIQRELVLPELKLGLRELMRLGRSAVLTLTTGLFVAVTFIAFAAQSGAPQPGRRWYKGNTHTHTLNSDGDSTPDDVVRWYREHGYQFLVLTDHNFLTSVAGLQALHGADDQFLVIPGEEITDRFGRETASTSTASTVRERVAPQGGGSVPEVLQRNVDAIRKAGGVPHINHPNFPVGGDDRGARTRPEQQAVRDLQRPSADQQPRRRRCARDGGGVGRDPLGRHAALRHCGGRRAHVQGSGQSERGRARARVGGGARAAPGVARDARGDGTRRLLRVHRAWSWTSTRQAPPRSGSR